MAETLPPLTSGERHFCNGFRNGFLGTVISEMPGRSELNEMRLTDYAEREGKTPVEAMFDYLYAELPADLRAQRAETMALSRGNQHD